MSRRRDSRLALISQIQAVPVGMFIFETKPQLESVLLTPHSNSLTGKRLGA